MRPPAQPPPYALASPRARAIIVGAGAWGPLGVEALQVAMCARAGRLEPRPTRFVDARGHRISVARAPALPDDRLGQERLIALAAPALREVFAVMGLRGLPALPLFLAAPLRGEGEAGADEAGADEALLAALAEAASAPVDAARSAVIRGGRAAFAHAAARALTLLEDGEAQLVLLGGVDSLYDEARLTALDRAGRLDALEVRGGTIPSEGAAFLALAWEPGVAPALGTLALTGPGGAPPRTARALRDLLGRDEELGELGAATGPVLAAITCATWEAGCAPAPRALVPLCDDDDDDGGPEPAALILEQAASLPLPPPPSRLSASLAPPSSLPSASLAPPPSSRSSAFLAPPPSSRPAASLAPPSSRPAVSLAPPPSSSSTALPPPPFRASVGVPALHRLAPARSGEVPDEEARPQLRRLARDCLEDIAIFGDLWRQREDEAAPVVAGLEQQVLDNLDALIALLRRRPAPEAIKELSRCAVEISFPDRGRGFALALTLGCVDDEEATRAAISAMRKADPGTLPAWEAGLRLASNPDVGPALTRLLRSERSLLVRFALEVLRARGGADLQAIAPLLGHPDARVRAAAARCAASVAPFEDARALLEQKLADADDAVALVAAEGLLLRGAPEALAWLRARLQAEVTAPGALQRDHRAHAARLLSLAGGEGDLGLLLAAVGDDARAAELLGWYGHPGAVDPLIGLLEQVDRALSRGAPVRGAELAIARALTRITGAPLDPDPAAWRARWASPAAAPAARLRFGAPYAPAVSLDELSRDDTPLRVRRECALELALHLGPSARVDVDGWSATQREAIARIRRGLAAGELCPTPPGAWLADQRNAR